MHFLKKYTCFATTFKNQHVMRLLFDKNLENMAKILRVIDPFFEMNVDDTFVLSEDEKFYVAEKTEEFHTATPDSEGDFNSSYKSWFKISPKWAKQLIEEGYLAEDEPKKTEGFVNVFDEIDTLLKKYQKELNSLSRDMKDAPECLKVERTTVLTNIISVLNHLKTLRK